MSERKERQWILAIQRGDKKYLQDIAEKYYDDIFRFCAFQTGSVQDAYDLAQETFLRFIRYVENYQYRNLKGYLLTIAMNVCRNYHRRNYRERESVPWEEGMAGETIVGRARKEGDMAEESRIPGKEQIPEEVAVEREETEMLMRALGSLSDVQREAILLAVVLLLHGTALRQGDLLDYLWWGSMAAAWLGQMACGELARHLSGGMAELEQSCYINLPQMWTIRMILAGSVDILILCICCGGIVWNTGSDLARVGIYLLVPFVLSNLCGFLLLEAIRGSRGRYGQAVPAVWIVVLALVPVAAPVLYGAGFLWLWVAALVLGTALLAWVLRRCYRKIERGEGICWN